MPTGALGYLEAAWTARTEARFARSQHEREQLAKEWLLRMIERTPLPEVGRSAGRLDRRRGAAADRRHRRRARRTRRPPPTASSSRPSARRAASAAAGCATAPGRRSRSPATSPRCRRCWSRRSGARSRSAGRATSRARSSAWPRSSARSRARSPSSLVDERSGGAAPDELTGLPGTGAARRVDAGPARRAAPLRRTASRSR